MHTLVTLIAVTAGLLGPAAAQTPDAIAIEESWAPATIGRSRTGVAYMTIVNRGDVPDRLVGASSPSAGKVELHVSEITGGIARMRPVPVMEIKPRQPVTLKPGGLHLMLMDLKAPLAAGGEIPITLQFEKAGAIAVVVKVGKPEAPAAHTHH
jgi:copper(I)-binding protein